MMEKLSQWGKRHRPCHSEFRLFVGVTMLLIGLTRMGWIHLEVAVIYENSWLTGTMQAIVGLLLMATIFFRRQTIGRLIGVLAAATTAMIAANAWPNSSATINYGGMAIALIVSEVAVLSRRIQHP